MDDQLKRNNNSAAALVTKALESIGLLNKGSAALSTGVLEQVDAAANVPITPPSLNVTRVTGVGAVVTSAGFASLTLFNVDKVNDNPAVVAAAFVSVGAIVVAALILVAIVVSSDIRARSAAITPSTDSSLADSSIRTTAAAAAAAAKADQPSLDAFVESWDKVARRLANHIRELPSPGDRNTYSKLWLRATATTGISPTAAPNSALTDEQALLHAAQMRICELLKGLIEDMSKEDDVQGEIRAISKFLTSTVLNLK